MLSSPLLLGHGLGFRDLTPMHGAWMEKMLRAKEDMTLQAHRGSYKTTCLGIVIALIMLTERDKNIIFLRKTDNDVAEVIRLVHRILRSGPVSGWLRARGEELKITRCNGSEITTSLYAPLSGSVQLLGIGIGGSLTGKHADIVITDDIVNLKDRFSRAERERTKNAYQELQNIKNRGGRIINTGTPWHKEDCFCLMPEPDRYDCYNTGLMDADQIEQLRRSMSPSLFAANYELRHIAREDALFAGEPRFTQDPLNLRDGIAHIDAAYGGGDCTALTCACRAEDTIYLYGRLWQGHVQNVLDAALRECDRLMCAPVYCETNADKGYLGREIRARGHEARLYSEHENKYFKISSFLRKWWDHIVFLEGTDRDYLEQILDYSAGAAHDDAPDSAASLIRVLDRRE
ncbi:MAG: hypothetical protein CW338_01540 [Clostridiales bacterium]|nr:hypothetical protein [Clostridiales bacterium]